MPGVPFTARSATVQVLTGIALVLFCLVFLRFVTLIFTDDTPRYTSFVTVFDGEALTDPEIRETERALDWAIRRFEQTQKQMKHRRCGNDGRYERFRQAKQDMLQTRLRLLRLQEQRGHQVTMQRELMLRAAQNPEVDETLRSRLGMGEAVVQIPIMQ